MSKHPSIFERMKLQPNQLRTVADRRFDDAVVLVNTEQNARANGAMYLGGFVVECLLKAALLEKYRWLQNAGSSTHQFGDNQRLWTLCYRLHDLEELLTRLPELKDRIAASGTLGRTRLLPSLKAICVRWTIFARYSPRSAMIAEAEEFLAIIRELKPWLR